MKNLILLTSLWMLLFGCKQKQTYYKNLTNEQVAFLSNPAKNDIVIYNTKGTLDSLIADTAQVYYYYNDPGRGGMFSSPDVYFTQRGSLTFKSIKNPEVKITFSATANNSYEKTAASQTINIQGIYNPNSSSYYSFSFSNKIPLKTINGRQYHDVVVAVAGNDSLFMRKDLGILAWKKDTNKYITYRVF